MGKTILPLEALPDKGVRTIVIATWYVVERIVMSEFNHVYDEHLYGIDIGNIKIERPDLRKIKNDDSVLIITTTRFQHQIRKKLLAYGFEEGKNFIGLSSFYEKIYREIKVGV